jgi:mRNA-degrading endonuclease YafQ of YafQ-DinJ toxin-antitoxin module
MKINEVTHDSSDLLIESILWESYTNIVLEAVDIKVSPCFDKANKKHLKNARVQQALKKFLVAKAKNSQAPYGGKDYPMTGKGPLSGIKHAGLTNDVSVMYEIKNNTIFLFAIGSHDDLGFGRPNNIKKQQSLVKKINNFCNNENI